MYFADQNYYRDDGKLLLYHWNKVIEVEEGYSEKKFSFES